MSEAETLSYEIQHLRRQLTTQFQGASWGDLAGTLVKVADVGQVEGQMELCLRAQSLRELMGDRSGGRDAPGPRVQELFHDLMFHLSHLQWQAQDPSLSSPPGSSWNQNNP